MRIVPIDTSRLKLLVVGEPTPQMRDGKAVLDRTTGQPLWNLDVTVIGEGRAETVQLTLPEGGFPKGLGIGALIVAEGLTEIKWQKDGRHGEIIRAKSVKVEGGQAGLKSAAA